MIIGLTGKNGSGKGEVANYLKICGFEYYSLSDMIREEIRKKRQPITRERLIQTGIRLRQEHGPGVLSEKILTQLQHDRNYVIDSIRNPEEVIVLRRRSDFVLVKVTAATKVRFERVKKRGRENDPRTFKNFVAMEARELKSKDPAAQQLLATEKCANRSLDNSGNLSQLHQKTVQLLAQIAKSRSRPSWDIYFMDIARMASRRSNCVKRQVAAVIVKDKRIVATGYNGTPRGVPNCNEGGCPRCNRFESSGANLDECYCCHAEENAITQSAYHGVSIKDATIYTTFSPCLICTKMIINSGIKEVVYDAHYPLIATAIKLLKGAKVKVRKLR